MRNLVECGSVKNSSRSTMTYLVMPKAMTTIEKVCNFIGFFMLLGLASLAEDPKPSFIFTYLLITAFFLTAGRAWRINRK